MLDELSNKVFDKIAADILDRSGIGNEWEQIDDVVMSEIRREWMGIISSALQDAHREEMERAFVAFTILRKYQRNNTDLDAYLLAVVEWGRGERNDKPDPKSYGVEP